MSRAHIKSVLVLLLSCSSSVLLAADSALIAPPTAGASPLPATRSKGQPSLETLRSAVLSYAGRYREKLGFAVDKSMAHTQNAGQRFGLQATKVAYVSAMISIATRSDPVLAVRDIVVSLKLQRIIWDDPKREADFPPAAVSAIRTALLELEQDALGQARKVVTSETMTELQRQVLAWRKANPDQDYVAYVLLDTTETAPLESRWINDAHRSGFLAPVNEAARQIALAKETAERSLFLLNQLPMLAEWNSELLVMRVLTLPEVQSTSDYAGNMLAATENLQSMVGELPKQIAEERTALLTQFAALFRSEREATFTKISDQASTLAPLLRDLTKSSEALRDAIASLERMFPVTAATGEHDSIAALDTLVQRTVTLTGQVSKLLGEVRPILEPSGSRQAFSTLDATLARHERRLFFFGVALVLIAGVVLVGVAWFTRRHLTP